MKNNKQRIALVIHGFPGLPLKYPIRDYFHSRKYQLLVPKLFEDTQTNRNSMLRLVEQSLRGKKPSVIVAFSMGGFLIPNLSSKYKNAKIVIVASGARLKMDIKIYDWILKHLDIKIMKQLFSISHKVPFDLYKAVFSFFNPFTGKPDKKELYYRNIKSTYDMFGEIPTDRLPQILYFARSVDITNKLRSIKNKTIIFSSDKDILMPSRLSVELNQLIEKSILIQNKGRLHHEVFDERDFEVLDKFLLGD